MSASVKVPNRLINEKSPYLLQHAYNPVDWYPWCDEAFAKAKTEDKPVFLSIGYSACHWCHVMEHESFENENIAALLNEKFISIKVDKEERPDIDSVYMRVCQALTGGGGWPTSIFITPDQKPFFAGTYFPAEYFHNILTNTAAIWETDRNKLLTNGEMIVAHLNNEGKKANYINKNLLQSAYGTLKKSYDSEYGGFGRAPKFPSPHNLLFLMRYAEYADKKDSLDMAEHTLLSMYKGGLFDHIGYGFSRYSTDKYWLIPHFEKMLYDNALLAVAYLHAFEKTGNDIYKSVAEKIFNYIETEMTDSGGCFFSAQDADSEGVEGKFYLFTPEEVINVLEKQDGEQYNNYYDITQSGNFEGRNIANLLKQEPPFKDFNKQRAKLYEYRNNRIKPGKDKKVLTAWNSLMIWAYAEAGRILREKKYLTAAERATNYIELNLKENNTLFVSVTGGKKSGKGFLDDYAFYILALISMYGAAFYEKYLLTALDLTEKTIKDFSDKNGGFFLYELNAEQLIIRPKDSYDGAIPSGNSVMAYNLNRLAALTHDNRLWDLSLKQREFMKKEANDYPSGYCFFLYSMLPEKEIVCVLNDSSDIDKIKAASGCVIRVYREASAEYPLLNDKTTFYICEENRCLPPTNDWAVIE